MDIRMPELDGRAATATIVDEADFPVRVLILTTFDPDECVYKALRAGASGFVLKDIPPEQLAPAVRTVADGGALLSPSITRRLIGSFAEQLATDSSLSGRLDRLTDREPGGFHGDRPLNSPADLVFAELASTCPARGGRDHAAVHLVGTVGQAQRLGPCPSGSSTRGRRRPRHRGSGWRRRPPAGGRWAPRP